MTEHETRLFLFDLLGRRARIPAMMPSSAAVVEAAVLLEERGVATAGVAE